MINRTGDISEDSALREATALLNDGATIEEWNPDLVVLVVNTSPVTYVRSIHDADRSGPFNKLVNLVAGYPDQTAHRYPLRDAL